MRPALTLTISLRAMAVVVVVASAIGVLAMGPAVTVAVAATPAPAPLSPAPAVKTAAGPGTGRPVGSAHATIPPGPPPRLLPLSEVRPGMVGEALTVFQGTKPEAFKVRVVSIMRQFLPKQDVILIRADDPRLAFSGIVAGMSGSPVYVGGRLMGAIAYGWSFAKEPLGGVTPIETMLAERARPRRTSSELAAETGPDGITALTLGEGGGGTQSAVREIAARDEARDQEGAGAGFWPPARITQPERPNSANFGEPHLIRVAVPLSVSGFDPGVLAAFTREFPLEGLVPVQAGGGGKLRVRQDGKATAGHVEPGSAIGIELVRGDMSMVGTGTVTYVDGNGVLAFGHPMFGAGEIYLPLVDAEIHAILPSLSQSMKLSSPLHEVGALVQDRQSCVIGDLGSRATMVPVSVRITAPGAPPRMFHAEVARNRRLTPALAALVINNALTDAEPDAADMVVKVTSSLRIKGQSPIELKDQIFAPEGIARQSLSGTRGLRAITDLLSNPFEPVVLERFDVDITIEYRRDVAEIVAVSLPGDDVRPGQTVGLRVSLRAYHGPEYTETIPIVIPRGVAGDTVRIEVASGGVAKPDIPSTESLPILLANLQRYFVPTSIVVSVQTPDDGAALHGRLLPDLPAAAADTLRPGNQTRRADSFRVADRTVHPMTRMIFGRQELAVYVREDVLGSARMSDSAKAGAAKPAPR